MERSLGTVITLFVRGPHVPRKRWLGWKNGWELQRRNGGAEEEDLERIPAKAMKEGEEKEVRAKEIREKSPIAV